MATGRYLRHSLIDWFSQDQVKNSKIAVIGAGAVGNEVIKNLTLLGVGHIDIYDFDTIEIHNLTRSVLFRETDIDCEKAVTAKKRAKELDGSVHVTSFHGDVWETLTLATLKTYTCVISGVDNFDARLKLSTLCLLCEVDFINVGIDSRYASVEVFPYSGIVPCACYECNLPGSVYERIQDRYSCGWLKKASYTEKKIPTTIITSSIAGAISASVALRLCNCDAEIGSYKILYDTINNSLSKTSYDRHDDCIVCTIPRQKILLRSSNNGDCFDSINVDSGLKITTSDQIIVRAVCKKCNKSFDEYTYRNTRRVSDRIMKCDICDTMSVDVVIKDSFTVDEFKLLTSIAHLDTKYFSFLLNNIMYIVEME